MRRCYELLLLVLYLPGEMFCREITCQMGRGHFFPDELDKVVQQAQDQVPCQHMTLRHPSSPWYSKRMCAQGVFRGSVPRTLPHNPRSKLEWPPFDPTHYHYYLCFGMIRRCDHDSPPEAYHPEACDCFVLPTRPLKKTPESILRRTEKAIVQSLLLP